tara:strand:- start:10738 stop:12642 length:1905 start_codon:yes stop_codon:yes gene_type:complete
MQRFADLLGEQFNIRFANYHDLREWSVDNVELFWQALWDYSEIRASKRSNIVLADAERFPGAKWFPDARLNFAENLLRYRDDKIALISRMEDGRRREISYAELYAQVAGVAAALRVEGVVAGDRVAGFMPNVIETVVAMLAATSLGAIWTSCSPDFGINGVIDRFGQIEPKVLFACDGYLYNGKTLDSLPRVAEIATRIDSLQRVVVVPVLGADCSSLFASVDKAVSYEGFAAAGPTEVEFEQLPFDHPVYVVYSSGTTGVPKCIVHGAGGTLIQHQKEYLLHMDVSRDDVFFYYSTCGWVMWNILVSGLATGATLVLYDGSPFSPTPSVLIDMAEEEGITVFGGGAKYYASLEKFGVKPRETHDLSALKTILSTGSPLSEESYEYIYRDIKSDVCLSSISGGTDIISAFVEGSPTLPVYSGELQCRGLGMAIEVWDDDGNSVVGEKGELVCVKPFPCSPLGFWNDPEDQKFLESYFSSYPGVWSQGDFAEITEHDGMIIYGRSDTVLNPGGVRIGTAEIYRQVERVDAVLDSVCIGQEWADDVRVVLFVILRQGVELDEALQNRIRDEIRSNATPRHVPSKIIAVPDIPRTLSGKNVELAVRSVVHGRPVKNTDALANPDALAYFADCPELRV